MSVESFVHRSPASKVVFAAGAIATLAAELAELGVRRPLLVAGVRTAASPVYAAVKQALSAVPVVEFTSVPAHSSVAAVTQIRDLARAAQCDGFVAVGGGSAADTAKAAALWLAEGGELEQWANRFTPPATLVAPELRQPKLPVVAVPCTASAAEVTPSVGVRTDDGRKLLFSDPKLACRLIVIDPQANVAVPAELLLSTGMNGLAHCIEGLYSKMRTPVTTAVALHGIRLFMQALPAVAREPQSVAARAELLSAAHLSGLVLLNARTCFHHAVCHALGAVTGVAHGEANSVVLPHAIRFNAPAAVAELALAAEAMQLPSRDGAALADAVAALQQSIGAPARLRDIGVPQSALARVAAKTMGERGLYFNPRPIAGADEVQALLEQAW